MYPWETVFPKDFSRHTLKWSENGDCVQAPPDKWTTDYLSAIISTHPYVLCYFLLQTHLLWSSSYCKPVHFIGNYNSLHQVTIACCAVLTLNLKYILMYFNVFSVMDKLPATSYVRLVDIWLIFVQLYPFIEESLCNNVIKTDITIILLRRLFLQGFLTLGCVDYHNWNACWGRNYQ